MKNIRAKVRRSMKRTAGVAGVSTAMLVSTAALAGGATLLYSGLEMPESLIAKWLVRPLAAASLAAVGESSGGLPTSVGSSTTQSTPPAAPPPPTKLGMNLGIPIYYNTVRAFSNLAWLGRWRVSSKSGTPEESFFDANGAVIKYIGGDTVYHLIGRPNELYRGKSVDIVCKFDGTAKIIVHPNAATRNIVNRANQVRFTYVMADAQAQLKLTSVDPANPARNLDCREPTRDPNQVFDPEYIASLKRYDTIRFMEWQNINENSEVTWAGRSRVVGKTRVKGPDVFEIETMIDLANAAGVNPWFCVPWNADADYVRNFARLVRDRLDPKLTAYVEASNEVWNWVFPVTAQAANEGLAAGLSTDKHKAMLYRYAQRTGEIMDVWTQEFAGQEDRLVRVLANHHALPNNFKLLLAWGNTADKIDAVASAPYFGANLDNMTVDPNDLSPVFTKLSEMLDLQLNSNGTKIKALADQYGKRLITYEAGQHVLGKDFATNKLIQDDPRMAALYTQYLRNWQANYGDLMMLFNDVGVISQYGAFGVLENAGQQPGATQKSRAVLLFQSSIGK